MRPTVPLAVLLATLSGCTLGEVEMRSFSTCSEYVNYMKHGDVLGGLDLAGIALGGGAGGGLDLGDILIADLDENGERTGAGPDVTEPGQMGAESWTDTNVQHEGVDEADLVKTDGTWVYAISGGKLVVSLAWPVEDATQVAVLPVDGSAVGLYLREGTVVVISTLEAGETPDSHSDFEVEEGEDWRTAPATVVTVFDVTNPRAIAPIRETYTTGALRESRLIDGRLYVVTTEEVGQEDGGHGAFSWLSLRVDNVATDDGWTTTSDRACDCDDIVAPSGGSAESTLTNVVMLDLEDPKSDFVGAGIVGPAGVVYASTTSLYLASSAMPEEQPDSGVYVEFSSGSLRTDLHKFDLTGPAPEYVASTSVVGVIPDRFGLSEHEGVLRVATMDTELLSSGITTLETRDGVFVELDRVDGLAPGETMTAARFVGDLGYLVTYVEKVDPLFAIDLKDPTNIEVGGDLSISGWSDYLHPMAERGKLLAVGTDFEWDGSPVLTASIFDVSDVSWPKLHSRFQFEADTSEASDDHHAFTYDPLTGFASIPSTRNDRVVLEVIKATAANGIVHKGRLSQPAYGGADAKDCRDIRRSVHLDGMVWAYSAAGLTAADLSKPEAMLGSVAFTGVDPCVGLTGPDDDRQIEVP